MGWFAQTNEAKEQLEICRRNKCNGCNKCVWIEESANAMIKHGKIVEKKHPLYEAIKSKFGGIDIE